MSSHHFGCGQCSATRSRDEGLQAQFASSPLASSISIGWLKWIFMLLSQSAPGRNNITSSDSDKGNRACPIQGEYIALWYAVIYKQELHCQKTDWCDRDGIFRVLYIHMHIYKEQAEQLLYIFIQLSIDCLIRFFFHLQLDWIKHINFSKMY